MNDRLLSGLPLVAATRGGCVESIHAVAACAVDIDGRVLLELGTIDVPVFLRSTAKPFIAAAVVRAGCAERFAFDDREIAVIAASHGGEPFHVDAVRSILAKIGVSPDALQCGTHAPAYEPAAAELAARGETPSALHNNCSGKHAGVLALTRLRGSRIDAYLETEHPAEAEILALCERVTGERFDRDRIAVDGCGIPVYATSLRNAARSFARFAALEDLDAADARALRRVRDAVAAHPEMIAGTGRLDSVLARASGGRIIAKAGAEGVEGCAVVDRKFGLVLKVVDGSRRAAAPAAVELLDRLDALDADLRVALAPFARAAIRNVAGRDVGSIEPLRAATAGSPAGF